MPSLDDSVRAYDLYFTRTIGHATIVRGDEAEEVFEDGADVRQPVTAYAEAHGLTVLEPAFQTIRQAVAVPRDRSAELGGFVEELKESGFVAASLERGAGGDGPARLSVTKR